MLAVFSGQVRIHGEPMPEPVPCDQAAAYHDAWIKVFERRCLMCHRDGGEADASGFHLTDEPLGSADARAAAARTNAEMLRSFATAATPGDLAPLLVKATGGDNHGGGAIIATNSAAYRVLEAFVESLHAAPGNASFPTRLTDSLGSDLNEEFLRGVSMISHQGLLRRATLSLAGRLPTAEERGMVDRDQLAGVGLALDRVMQEDAFYLRLREAFNDLFLTLGIDGNADATVLSYEHFEKTRLWYQHHDLTHIADDKERLQAGYKLANDYRAALLDEPMRLIEYIVRHDRPFSEIVTADYIMVSPYTARGYGVFDELKDQFDNLDDPFGYVPVKLKALVGRNRSEDQDSATGFYPHAGVLSTFQYLSRYPTTETNRNRLRARMYYQHFLGVDVLEMADRVSDAAAVTAAYEIPTMQAAECVVCHRTLDPVAGLFQDYFRFDANFAIYGKRKEGWFGDMFSAGFEEEALPESQRWRALQWLGERTVEDPRFAVAMTEHALAMLTGRRPLLPPSDLDDPHYAARYRAYRFQRGQLEATAARFASQGFNFKSLLKDLVASDLYRAEAVDLAELPPDRLAELDDVGVVRLLSPEQLERKIEAIFGTRWGKLSEQTAILYGGIDSKEVTERASDPSGAMGSLQRTMANDVSCRHVALDFSRQPERRRLFPSIEPSVLPGSSPEADAEIREAIVFLHQHVLGRDDAADSAEVDRTFALFSSIVQAAHEQPHIDPRETWACRQGLEREVDDPHYTVRAWRGVVTYLLRRREFLYE
jgi:hypothetical protein